jgi:phage major head subunit gpT-like protein
VCYDGQYFFDTDHSEGSSGNQSNKISVTIANLPSVLHGSTSNPSVEEMQQAILAGITQMLAFVDDKGEPMNELARSFTVMVPVGLYMKAVAAVTPMALAALPNNLNGNNLADFTIKVVQNTRLTTAGWTTKFTIWRTDAPTKGLIRQTEKEVEFKMKDENSEFAFDNDAIQAGIDGWRGAGYGHWQRACHVTLA